MIGQSNERSLLVMNGSQGEGCPAGVLNVQLFRHLPSFPHPAEIITMKF